MQLKKLEGTDKLWDVLHGDLLYMEDKLRPARTIMKAEREKFAPIFFSYLRENQVDAWEALFGPDALDRYDCPYTNRDYFWAIPFAVLVPRQDIVAGTKSEFVLKWEELVRPHLLEMSLDAEWNWSMYGHEFAEAAPGRVQTCLLGSGYTECTMASDGFGSVVLAEGELETGEIVFFMTNLWHNK